MKKVILIVIPVLLVGGGAGAFFAASKGIIQIPGISPKKVSNATALYGADKDAKVETVAKSDEKETEAKRPKPAAKAEPEPDVEPALDLSEGQKKLASLWNEMEIDALIKTTTDWKPDDLAPVFKNMDPEKVAAFLSKVSEKDAPRSSAISRAIQIAVSKAAQV